MDYDMKENSILDISGGDGITTTLSTVDDISTVTIKIDIGAGLEFNGYNPRKLRVNLDGGGIAGTLATADGGTGNNSSYNQYGVVYASTTTKLEDIGASTSSETDGDYLKGSNGAAPAWTSIKTAVENNVPWGTPGYIGETTRHYARFLDISYEF